MSFQLKMATEKVSPTQLKAIQVQWKHDRIEYSNDDTLDDLTSMNLTLLVPIHTKQKEHNFKIESTVQVSSVRSSLELRMYCDMTTPIVVSLIFGIIIGIAFGLLYGYLALGIGIMVFSAVLFFSFFYTGAASRSTEFLIKLKERAGK